MSGSTLSSPPPTPTEQPSVARQLNSRVAEGNMNSHNGVGTSREFLSHVYLHGPTHNNHSKDGSATSSPIKMSALRDTSALSSDLLPVSSAVDLTLDKKAAFEGNHSHLGLYDSTHGSLHSENALHSYHIGLDSAVSGHSFSDVPYQLAGIGNAAATTCRSQFDTIPRYNSLPSPSLNRHGLVPNASQAGNDEMIAGLGDFAFQHFPHQEQQSSPGSSGPFLRSSLDASSFSSSTHDSYNAIPLARRKRNKCSPEQYRQLESFFAKNRNPTGKVREELSRRIQMPERSVQVWFQNKRAKAKSNRPKDEGSSGQGTSKNNALAATVRRMSHSSDSHAKRGTVQGIEAGERSQQSTILQLPCLTLCIGEWRRIKPLICLFSRRNQSFTWYISSESVGFKLECPLSNVERITFSGPTEPTIHELNEGLSTSLGCLSVHLARPPQFYMEVFRSSGKSFDSSAGGQRASWRQCTDFTEGKQATIELEHRVSGPYNLLRQAVMELQDSNENVSRILEFQDQGRMEQMQIKQYQYWTEQHDRLMYGQQQASQKMMQPQSENHFELHSPHRSQTFTEGHSIDLHSMGFVTPSYAGLNDVHTGDGPAAAQHQHQHSHPQPHPLYQPQPQAFASGHHPFSSTPQDWAARPTDADSQLVLDLYPPFHAAGLELVNVPLQSSDKAQESHFGVPHDPRLSPEHSIHCFRSWPYEVSEEEEREANGDEKEAVMHETQANPLGTFPRSVLSE